MAVEVDAFIFDPKGKYPKRGILFGLGPLKKVFFAQGDKQNEARIREGLSEDAKKEGYTVLGTKTRVIPE